MSISAENQTFILFFCNNDNIMTFVWRKYYLNFLSKLLELFQVLELFKITENNVKVIKIITVTLKN